MSHSHIIAICVIGLLLSACSPVHPAEDASEIYLTTWFPLQLDTAIIDSVKNHRTDSAGYEARLDTGGSGKETFITRYQNEDLEISVNDDPAAYVPLIVHHHWQHDTLFIDGTCSSIGFFGFSAWVQDGRAMLWQVLGSDSFADYARTETGPFAYVLDVPCSGTQLILHTLPDSTNADTLYGYAQFKSNSVYERIHGFGKEAKRQRVRSAMRVFFRSMPRPVQ